MLRVNPTNSLLFYKYTSSWQGKQTATKHQIFKFADIRNVASGINENCEKERHVWIWIRSLSQIAWRSRSRRGRRRAGSWCLVVFRRQLIRKLKNHYRQRSGKCVWQMCETEREERREADKNQGKGAGGKGGNRVRKGGKGEKAKGWGKERGNGCRNDASSSGDWWKGGRSGMESGGEWMRGN